MFFFLLLIEKQISSDKVYLHIILFYFKIFNSEFEKTSNPSTLEEI